MFMSSLSLSLSLSSSSSSFKPHLHHPTTKTNTCCFLSFKLNNSHFQFHYYYYYHHHQTTTTTTRSRYCCGCGGGGSEWETESSLLEEGRSAVATYIEQLGVSKEDSITIASNSPSYLNMLLDGVRDLDQLSMWECDDTSSSSSSFSLKDKIVHLATLKGGDNGAKVAFLESIGFTLSSSINLARYLISSPSSSLSHSLPHLIHNVNSIKLLLFSHDDHDSIAIVKTIRRMMRFLSIPIDEDLQHTLSFFAKLEARRGGLNTLAATAASSKDSAFVSLIESFPRLLLLSANNHVLPLFHFLENFGIPRPCIPYILLCFPPILLWNPQLLKTRLLAFKQIDVVGNDYAKLLIQYPWLLSASIQDNYEEVLDFFYTEKIPKTLLDRAIKSQPHILACSTSKLKLMVDQFAELGINSKKLDKVIAKSPQLLLRNPKDFQQIVLFFENMGFDNENIGRILARCPEIFVASINKTLQRKIEFLSRIGVCETYLARVIRKYPELLVSNTDRTLLHRLVYLMKLGLSEKDIAFMVRTFSPLLGYSIEEVLRPKIEFLMNSMERPVRDVVSYPRYFSYSLEKKIKPRYWMLKGRNIECSLKDMLGKNDEEFAAEFMGPPLASHDRL